MQLEPPPNLDQACRNSQADSTCISENGFERTPLVGTCAASSEAASKILPHETFHQRKTKTKRRCHDHADKRVASTLR